MSDLIWNSKLQGGSPRLCQLRPASVEPWWTSTWMYWHIRDIRNPQTFVALCVNGLDNILPRFTGVQWDSVRATHGVSAEAYTWKMTLGWGMTQLDFLASSWIVATRVAFVAHVCRIVRFIPLQGWLLIRISTTPSNMGDDLFAVFKRRIVNFIILWW
jgi:hypothetical protein